MTKIININKIIVCIKQMGGSAVTKDVFYKEILKNPLVGEGTSTTPMWKKHVQICENLGLSTDNPQTITLSEDGEKFYGLIKVESGKKMLDLVTDEMKTFLVEKIMQKKSDLQKKMESSIGEYTMKDGEEIHLIGEEEIKKMKALDSLLVELELVKTLEREVPPNAYDSGGLSEEEHWKRLETQRKNGKKAEEKTVQFEKERLKHDHKFDDKTLEKVKRVSKDDTSVGYDIDSFNGDKFFVDRYIEVKCTTGRYPIFYWSENEIKKAQELGNQYFIYLWINFDKKDERLLEPIQDPYRKIIENDSIKKERKIVWRISWNEQN